MDRTVRVRGRFEQKCTHLLWLASETPIPSMSAMWAATAASRLTDERQQWAIPVGGDSAPLARCCARPNGGKERILLKNSVFGEIGGIFVRTMRPIF